MLIRIRRGASFHSPEAHPGTGGRVELEWAVMVTRLAEAAALLGSGSDPNPEPPP
jgi:hypothetical protein